MPRVFIRFLEEIEDTKKTFPNYVTSKISSGVYQKSANNGLSTIKEAHQSYVEWSFDLLNVRIKYG